MIRVRLGTGTTFDDFEIHYDTDWPVVPRVGEMATVNASHMVYVDLRVKDVCYVAGKDEQLIGALVLVEEVARHGRDRSGT